MNISMLYNTKQLLLTGLTSIVPFQMQVAQSHHTKKAPNLLYIFPDQYRLYALSLWSDPTYRQWLTTQGDPVHTPNIDRLAKEGIVFTQATSTHPVSSPHRAMLMSGMFPSQNGVEDLNCRLGREQELRHDIVCLTDVLANNNYQTAYIGKAHWHKTEALFDQKGTFVNSVNKPGGKSISNFDTYVPNGKSRHSNQFWYQQLNDNHFNAIVYSNRPELIEGKEDGEQFRPQKFTTEVEADVILKFLDNKNGERERDAPFSILWSINPPHPPFNTLKDCHEEIFNRYYRDMPIEDLLVRENIDTQNINLKKLELNSKIYFSLIKAVDNEIGRVLDKLEEIGEIDNTVIVFTSDHGEMMGSQNLMSKNYHYDESFLVPFIIRYPQRIKHRTENLLLGSVDIMPTLLGLINLGSDIPKTVMGVDYSLLLTSQRSKVKQKPKTALYLKNNAKGVRSNQYTYVVFDDGTYQLFDNLADPYQKKTIRLESIRRKDRNELQSQLGHWLKKAKDPWYYNNTNEALISYSN